MKEIFPILRDRRPMLCIETAAGPSAVVVFGASGDLTHRKLFPSLYELFSGDLISKQFYLIDGRSPRLICSFAAESKTPMAPGSDKWPAQSEPFWSGVLCAGGLSVGELSSASGSDCSVDKQFRVWFDCFIYRCRPSSGRHCRAAAESNCLSGAWTSAECPTGHRKPFGRDLKSAIELIANCICVFRNHRFTGLIIIWARRRCRISWSPICQ